MSIKVAIIGGAGRVGSNTAYALQCAGIVRQILIVDVNAQLAAGEALDLLHGSSIAADQIISSGPISAAADADLICITAGLRRKPDESRLELINRNVSLFKGILDELRSAKLRHEAILLVVSNPVDVLTRLAIEHLQWPASQVLGLGTVLDTARFRSLIAAAKGYAPTQVDALILGEHGDSMTPIWSSASVGGLPLIKFLSATEQNELFTRAQNSGAEVLKGKGGAGYAVGLSIAEVIHAVALDRRQILPISTRMTGQYGLRDVCLSIPTIVGRPGVIEAREIELWPKEQAGITRSGQILHETWLKLS